MTKYTDKQIIAAIKEAGGKKHPGTVYAWELSMYKQVINALPEPATDERRKIWIEDVRVGDRIRAEYNGGDTLEFNVTAASPEMISGTKMGMTIYENDPVLIYLLNRPVQHPDPAEYPVIYVKDFDIVGFIPKIMVWYRDSYVAGQQCLSPERITDWHPIDPAKVVADDA